ncbi:hypothetical protein Shyhy01_71050 [Streptomyces hygroscopicus subsp. hygroscopicus]|nr:hypothetical protein Shyhy01_71050 [Streptomyces hygroscopicus subsp. hygroscopicus]
MGGGRAVTAGRTYVRHQTARSTATALRALRITESGAKGSPRAGEFAHAKGCGADPGVNVP